MNFASWEASLQVPTEKVKRTTYRRSEEVPAARCDQRYAAPPKDKELSKRLFTIDFKSHVDASCPWCDV